MSKQNYIVDKAKNVGIDEEKYYSLLSEYRATLWRRGVSHEEKANAAQKSLLLYRFFIHCQKVTLRTKRAIRGVFEEVLDDLLELGYFESYRDLRTDEKEFTEDEWEVIKDILSRIKVKHADNHSSSSRESEALHGYLDLKDLRYYYHHMGVHSILIRQSSKM